MDRMYRNHSLTLIVFFSMIAIFSITGIARLADYHKPKTSVYYTRPTTIIPPQRATDLQIIQKASASGTVLCTHDDPGICEKTQEGKVLEYVVGCTSPGIVSSSIYICKSGRWEYIDWTSHGYCHAC